MRGANRAQPPCGAAESARIVRICGAHVYHRGVRIELGEGTCGQGEPVVLLAQRDTHAAGCSDGRSASRRSPCSASSAPVSREASSVSSSRARGGFLTDAVCHPTMTRTLRPPRPPRPPHRRRFRSLPTACATAVTMSILRRRPHPRAIPRSRACERPGVPSVFVTASDAGRGHDYSQKRQLGILRAYTRAEDADSPFGCPAEPVVARAVTRHHGRVPAPARRQFERRGFRSTGYASLPMLLNGTFRLFSPRRRARAVVGDAGRLSRGDDPGVSPRAPDHARALHRSRVAEGDHPDTRCDRNLRARGVAAGGVPPEGAVRDRLPVVVAARQHLAPKVAPYRVCASQDSVVACATVACLAKPRFGEWLQRSYLLTDVPSCSPPAESALQRRDLRSVHGAAESPVAVQVHADRAPQIHA